MGGTFENTQFTDKNNANIAGECLAIVYDQVLIANAPVTNKTIYRVGYKIQSALDLITKKKDKYTAHLIYTISQQ